MYGKIICLSDCIALAIRSSRFSIIHFHIVNTKNAELGMTGYVVFRTYIIAGGVI